jgi:hypothetical protein
MNQENHSYPQWNTIGNRNSQEAINMAMYQELEKTMELLD